MYVYIIVHIYIYYIIYIYIIRGWGFRNTTLPAGFQFLLSLLGLEWLGFRVQGRAQGLGPQELSWLSEAGDEVYGLRWNPEEKTW